MYTPKKSDKNGYNGPQKGNPPNDTLSTAVRYCGCNLRGHVELREFVYTGEDESNDNGAETCTGNA
jgi:hypothetical protein